MRLRKWFGGDNGRWIAASNEGWKGDSLTDCDGSTGLQSVEKLFRPSARWQSDESTDSDGRGQPQVAEEIFA